MGGGQTGSPASVSSSFFDMSGRTWVNVIAVVGADIGQKNARGRSVHHALAGENANRRTDAHRHLGQSDRALKLAFPRAPFK